ncbi:hypothetical protein BASA50_003190 [Batrachochytrium salamandrivorans]|uniref:Uncharacterized protein n=1 Tax=Batrachochytrium salamandrivorans TaxID=1357716 RepID=A0ABQ8FJ30_9FUNG|nr:hypothetical protein BASA62_008444 [Batrachochytrium salamandrivorans]KAH6566626.1 hypothetical protein BASA60_009387 [Batrachochytrium salamandrivorans]KAH6589153.1 hypothetical protein BASA61_005717 [Batrachochytrium salamandrivorans]KAH6599162.1 hypothetical protein BASA50_003190 [Batrachochytrium salamandrivorans]KAH9269151.1 hypothetical protein BASA83_008772 [Batrachochytrium salamandrivorans]
MGMIDGALKGLVRGAVRRRLTTKDGNKNFYKGTGSGRMGRFTQKGEYVVEPWRLRQYIVPDLSRCELKPFVSPGAENDVYKPHTLIDYFPAVSSKKGSDPALSKENATDDDVSLSTDRTLLMATCRAVALSALSNIRAPKSKSSRSHRRSHLTHKNK